jgi:hypothetical protein
VRRPQRSLADSYFYSTDSCAERHHYTDNHYYTDGHA